MLPPQFPSLGYVRFPYALPPALVQLATSIGVDEYYFVGLLQSPTALAVLNEDQLRRLRDAIGSIDEGELCLALVRFRLQELDHAEVPATC